MYIIEVKDLSKKFGGLRALEEVSFRIKNNSIFSIIGPNGAGKTTLFNCITGLTKPTRGEIYFKESDIVGLDAYEITRMGIARTFQNIRLFRDMTLIENVLTGMHVRTSSNILSAILRSSKFLSEEKISRERAYEYLEFVGLERYATRMAGELPYGDQRRLEIARALATEPEVILLDEPTAGMNPQETEEIMSLIKRLKDVGKTVVLIEHDMKVVMGVSEWIVVLDHGVKISEGTPDKVRNDSLVIEAYLGKDVYA